MDTELTAFGSDELTELFDFLDELRESGQTNMFGAAPYMQREFGVARASSHVIVKAWMDTFDGERPASDRAFAALAKAEA